MPTIALDCSKQTALKVIEAHTDTSTGFGSGDVYKRFRGSFDGDGFTIWRNTGSRNSFRVKAKGTVVDNGENSCIISLTFTQNILVYLFLAFVAIAVISLTSTMSFFTNGAVIYGVQVLTVSVLGIVAILSYNYQVNKIMSTIERLDGLK